MNYDAAVIESDVIIDFDGHVKLITQAVFTSTCNVDIQWYPFDQQTCDLMFGSRTGDIEQVRAHNKNCIFIRNPWTCLQILIFSRSKKIDFFYYRTQFRVSSKQFLEVRSSKSMYICGYFVDIWVFGNNNRTVPSRVTRGALVAHRTTYTPPRWRIVVPQDLYSPLSISVEISYWTCIRWRGTGGFFLLA